MLLLECWNSSDLARKSGLLLSASVWEGMEMGGSVPERVRGVEAGMPMYFLRRVVRRFCSLVSCCFFTARVWIWILVCAASSGESSPSAAALSMNVVMVWSEEICLSMWEAWIRSSRISTAMSWAAVMSCSSAVLISSWAMSSWS